jgi:hypothetical protein
MGVECRHYLIPRPNDYFPSASKMLSMIDALRRGSWICSPSSPYFSQMSFSGYRSHEIAESTGGLAITPSKMMALPFPVTEDFLTTHLKHDLILRWPVECLSETELRYPLVAEDLDRTETYYDLEIHTSPDYVYRKSELIEPFSMPVRCPKCNTIVEYDKEESPEREIFYSTRIHLTCPGCAQKINVSDFSALVRNGWDHKDSLSVRGGATSRFVLVIDCGKCIPKKCQVQPDLMELLEKTTRTPFYEIEDFY